jgi:hypothetical protein
VARGGGATLTSACTVATVGDADGGIALSAGEVASSSSRSHASSQTAASAGSLSARRSLPAPSWTAMTIKPSGSIATVTRAVGHVAASPGGAGWVATPSRASSLATRATIAASPSSDARGWQRSA